MVFQCINIRMVLSEVLKTEAGLEVLKTEVGGLDLQHIPQDLGNVNA